LNGGVGVAAVAVAVPGKAINPPKATRPVSVAAAMAARNNLTGYLLSVTVDSDGVDMLQRELPSE
jgi:hypothetical protein